MRSLTIFKGLPATSWLVDHHVCPFPVSILSREYSLSWVLISPTAPKAVWRICVDHIQLWAVVVCKLPSQTKAAIIRPVIIENIFRFSCIGLSQMQMSRITGVSQGAILKVPRRVHASSSFTQGLRGHLLKTITPKEDLHSPYHHENLWKNFLSASRADQANWTPSLCPHGSRLFSSSWILLKTSRLMLQTDSWSSLVPPHVGKQAPWLEPSALVDESRGPSQYKYAVLPV